MLYGYVYSEVDTALLESLLEGMIQFILSSFKYKLSLQALA
jgi:hypothetical protein